MRSVWPCSSCVAVFTMAFLGLEAMASQTTEAALLEKDTVHRVPKKPQITPPPQPLRLKRRGDDDLTCPVNHSLCPESLGGGCCPDQYECASDACSATTAALGTACGKVGYYWCPITAGQGCCPEGWVCDAVRGCIAPYGVTNTFTSCPTNYNLCPSSYNYGCCPNSMGCGVDACYSTEPFSTTLVDILTLTSGGKTITTTQVSAVLTTPTPPSALTAADDGAGVIPKFMPTSVPKASATPKDNKDDDGGGGLKGAQLGGIIGGAIALLIIVIIAAFLIIRRLKRVESAMESKKGSTSGYHSKASYTKTSKTGASKTEMEQSGRFLHVRAPSDADNASADPLMFMTETNTPGDHTGNTSSLAGTPQPGAHGLGRHNRSGSDAYMVSPHGGGGNNGSRLVSPDPNTGYFDGPSPPPGTHLHNNNGMRESVDSQSTGLGYHYSIRNQNQNHWRHQSNASELSADGSEITHGVGSPLVGSHARGASGSGLNDVPELDSSGMFVELPATATASNTTFGESPILPVNPNNNNNRLPPRNSFGGLSPASRRTSNPSSPNPNLIHNSPNPNNPHTRNDSTNSNSNTNSPLDVLSETAEFIPRPHQQQHTSLDGYYGPSDKQVGQTAAGLGFVPEAWDGSSPGAYPMGFPMISVPGYGLGVASEGAGGDGRDDGHETHGEDGDGEGEGEGGTLDTALDVDVDGKLEEFEEVGRGKRGGEGIQQQLKVDESGKGQGKQ